MASLISNFQVVTPRTTQMPLERNAHRIFADDNYVYLLGGWNCAATTPSRTLSDVWRFNRLTRAWQQCAMADPACPLPDTFASFSLVSRGPGPDFNCGSNEAYIWGTNKPTINKLYWIKIGKAGRVHLKLQTLLGNEQLPAQFGQGMCRKLEMNQQGILQEVIYIVGGTHSGMYNMDVWKLQRPAGANLDKGWDLTRLNRHIPDVLGRFHFGLVCHEEKLITFDGMSGRQDFPLNWPTIFDLKSNEFEQSGTRPDPVHGFPYVLCWPTLVHRGNMVYLLGGRAMEKIRIALDTIWRLSLKDWEWTKLPISLAVPIFWNSAAITPDGFIFLFSGVTHDQQGQHNRMNCLQRMWLRPPPLVQIAADRVLEGISAGQQNVLTEGVRLTDVPLFVSRIMGPDQEEKKVKDEKDSPDQEEEKIKNSPPPAAQHQESTSSEE